MKTQIDPNQAQFLKNIVGKYLNGSFMVLFFKISMMIPRSVIEEVGDFDTRFPFAPDYHLMLRIAAAEYDFDFVPEFLVAHRIHLGNETRNKLGSIKGSRKMLLSFVNEYPEVIKRYNLDIDYRMAVLDSFLARHYFISGDLKSTRKILYKVLWHYPSLILKSKRNIAYCILSYLPLHFVKKLKGIEYLKPLFMGN